MNGSAVGVGLIAGPYLGAVIYKRAGYANTMYIIAGLVAFNLMQHMLLVSAKVNDVRSSATALDEIE